ncbi:FAD:protein FMN transferase [Clostridium sp. B9]|uniref:FAD:protein FMN transferase n=1 Tax=Clostridium sp. B9 TaxID=3423224 RepID=UPI003D2F03F0
MVYLRNIIILLLLILTFNLKACTTNKEPVSQSNFFMGTLVNLTLYDKTDEKIFQKIFNEISKIEKQLSLNITTSEINEINNNAGIKPVKVSESTFNIIEKSIEISELSNGYFDITIGPLVQLWDIGTANAKVPTETEINSTIKLINFNNIILDSSNSSVYLEKEDMIIDLGGIAKGYIADIICNILIEEGVEKAIIDLGGNIFALGEKSNKAPWNIGIQNPFENRGVPLGTLEISNKSIVTSGIYERFFEEDGVKYHHILNPKTGYPFNNDLSSVTIISDKSLDGDALSTAVFALGFSEGLKLIESLENVDAIFVTTDKEVFLSSNIKSNFNLIDNSFKLIE